MELKLNPIMNSWQCKNSNKSVLNSTNFISSNNKLKLNKLMPLVALVKLQVDCLEAKELLVRLIPKVQEVVCSDKPVKEVSVKLKVD